jgi:hypothetical protein
MNLTDHPEVLAAGILEAGLLVGVFAVGAAMQRLRVNGPCRLCLSLLVAWRVCTAATLSVDELRAGYFAGLAFGYVFLYAVLHLARLVGELRRRRGDRVEPRWTEHTPARQG